MAYRLLCGYCQVVRLWATLCGMTTPAPVRSHPWRPADTFGSRLAWIRQELHWNVKQAADACGLPDQSWRNWEDGRSPRSMSDVVQAIAAATGVDRDWLMWGQSAPAVRPSGGDEMRP